MFFNRLKVLVFCTVVQLNILRYFLYVTGNKMVCPTLPEKTPKDSETSFYGRK
jgi:hypothetical protein